LRIGLTGGIASGKSVAARRLAELGAVVIDHDVLAREVVAPGSPGAAAVRRRFGNEVFDGEELDRAALGRLVFADAQARADLNAIVHPLVRELGAQREAEALREDPDAVVVHEIPLLVEAGLTGRFDLVLVVSAPVELRLRRLVQGRGLCPEEARGRIAAQADDAARAAVADVVLDGSGPADALREQVDA